MVKEVVRSRGFDRLLLKAQQAAYTGPCAGLPMSDQAVHMTMAVDNDMTAWKRRLYCHGRDTDQPGVQPEDEGRIKHET